jgi:putative glutathione S-transferase
MMEMQMQPEPTKLSSPKEGVAQNDDEDNTIKGGGSPACTDRRRKCLLLEDGHRPLEGNQRYHIFLSYSCPLCTRIFLKLNKKGLSGHIGHSVVQQSKCNDELTNITTATEEWIFRRDDGEYQNHATSDLTLREVYLRSDPQYKGNWTVPCLYDTKTNKIVSNDANNIMAMLGDDLASGGAAAAASNAFRPLHDIAEAGCNIELHQRGSERTQEDYYNAAKLVASGMETFEERLSTRAYIAGNMVSRADFQLAATLMRWDSIYGAHLNRRFVTRENHPNLWNYVRRVYTKDLIRKHGDPLLELHNQTHTSRYYRSAAQLGGIPPSANSLYQQH